MARTLVRRVVVEVGNALHVGDGEPLSPFEYAVTDGELRRLSLSRLAAALDEAGLCDLEAAAGRGARDVQALLASQKFADAVETATMYRCRLTAAARDVLENPRGAKTAALEVASVARTADGRPILPGSSVKGAIRTALLTRLLQLAEARGDRPPEAAVKDKSASRLEAWLLTGKDDMAPGEDPLRCLAVSDLSLGDASDPAGVVAVDACRRGKREEQGTGVPSLREVALGWAHPDRPAAGGATFVGELRVSALAREFIARAVASEWRREFFSRGAQGLFVEIVKACVLAYFPFPGSPNAPQGALDAETEDWVKKRVAEASGAKRAFFPLVLGWGSGLEAVTLDSEGRRATPTTRWWTSAGTRLGAVFVEARS